MEAGLKKKNANKTRWLKPVTAITLLTLIALQSATQAIALRFSYHANLGEPLHDKLYAPWQVINWHLEFYPRYQETFNQLYILSATITLLIAAMFISIAYVRKPKAIKELHGSAKWAEKDDIEETGMMDSDEGVYVGGWYNPITKITHYLRHSGFEPVISVAPTRSGKGLGQVLPTLLSWMQSVVVHDTKGENWSLTAGWRKLMGQIVIKFSPGSLNGSAQFNPLEEIRLGTDYEVSDAMDIANMIVDPEGKGLPDHWSKTAHSFLIGAILSEMYKGKKNGTLATLTSVGFAFSKPDELLNEMATNNYKNGESHEYIVSCAMDMLSKDERERSGVISTAVSFFTIYRDPIVARNTARSDFKIADLMRHEKPVSLYLVTPPDRKDTLRPLMRLMFNMIIRRLIGEMEIKNGEVVKSYKYSLLLLLDEFASLGKMAVFEEALAYMSGYGIKSYIILQNFEQLYCDKKGYGKNESITAQCPVKAFYTPNKLGTAEEISKTLGKATVIKTDVTLSGKRFSGTLNNVNHSLKEISRPLLIADEVMRLPEAKKNKNKTKILEAGDMLISVKGHNPIYGRQILHFMDPVFAERVKIEAPETSDRIIEPASEPAASSFKLETVKPKKTPAKKKVEKEPETAQEEPPFIFGDDDIPEDPRWSDEPPAYNYNAEPDFNPEELATLNTEDNTEESTDEFPPLPETTEEYPI